MSAEPIAATRQGRVRGLSVDGVQVFRGLRYAASTAGANRFRAPQPAEPWSGLLNAAANGPRCPQPDGIAGPVPPVIRQILGGGDAPMSEDCLRLNLFTPACDDGRRAVMVWLHGGYYTSGSGASPLYDGSALARAGDVVVVSVTHRLNLFGFLHLTTPDTEDFGQSANVGMLDLVAALAWVRDNIAAFGGDPGRVTLFGESGGGRKCAVLMAMPQARGLFHRAILQSGPGLTVAEPAYAQALADAVFQELDIPRAHARRLQALPWEALRAANAKVAGSLAGKAPQRGHLLAGFSPVLDGQVIPSHPFDPAAAAPAADVPAIVGSNRDEHALFLLFDPSLGREPFDAASLARRLQPHLGARTDDAIAAYRARTPQASPLDLFVAMETDRTYWINAVRIAERKAAQPAPVWMYRFDWPSPALDGRLKACHGLEIGFCFDNLDAARDLVGHSPEASEIARRMSGAWISFAKTGDPACADIPAWPSYAPDARRTMLIDVDWRVAADPEGWARDLWTA